MKTLANWFRKFNDWKYCNWVLWTPAILLIFAPSEIFFIGFAAYVALYAIVYFTFIAYELKRNKDNETPKV